MNREQRRHPEQPRPDEQERPPAPETQQPRPAETEEARAKSSGHGKKTADKWNQ